MDLAIEITLKTVATELNVRLPHDVKFPDLWTLVETAYKRKYGKRLPLKSEISTVHDRRNAVQHRGSVPSDTDLKQYMEFAFKFLDEVFLTVAGLRLDQVFLSSIIDNVDLREMMEVAEGSLSSNPKASMEASMKSFMWARLLAQRKLGHFDPTLGAFDPQDRLQRAMREPVTDVAKPILDHLLMLELGVDAVLYNRINQVAPYPFLAVGMTKPSDVGVAETLPSNYNESNAWLCYSFVLENILKWQDKGVF